MNYAVFSCVRYLFFITVVVLSVLGAGILMRVNDNPDMKIVYVIYALLMFGDAIAMLVCGLYIGRRVQAIYWFAVIVLGLNIILTIFDQFGLIDLLFSLLNVFTLAGLLISRKEFLPQ
jgi:hypothetical protein